DLQAGERVEVDKAKKDPLDFVLWKKAKPGEPYWNSPWGRGRPGWHIECSAMSTCCLGNHFDIHGGGMDLQFPHHENEIAQSEGATGEKFVNLWMHNGFVRVDDEKMSKSLGNFFTVREVLKQYENRFSNKEHGRKRGGEIIRFLILMSHYRSPLNYSNEQLEEAELKLKTFYLALKNTETEGGNKLIDQNFMAEFEEAINDDFNTPVALSVLFKIRKELNKAKSEKSIDVDNLSFTLRSLGSVLGILQNTDEIDNDEFLRTGVSVGIVEGYGWKSALEAKGINRLSEEQINEKIQLRSDAKKNKDWVAADKIRDELKKNGIILEDTPNGTTWRWT
ncbi:MAG: cysteine--tRNA ligase, partial [Gammaproteobacteria bacterium]